jgi:hypothetical protein
MMAIEAPLAMTESELPLRDFPELAPPLFERCRPGWPSSP